MNTLPHRWTLNNPSAIDSISRYLSSIYSDNRHAHAYSIDLGVLSWRRTLTTNNTYTKRWVALFFRFDILIWRSNCSVSLGCIDNWHISAIKRFENCLSDPQKKLNHAMHTTIAFSIWISDIICENHLIFANISSTLNALQIFHIYAR